jgi:hypothetical protein
LGFALKTGEGLRVAGNVFGQKFKSDKSVQECVFSFVNHANATPAKFLDDLIVGNGPADHEQMSALWSVYLMDAKVLSQQKGGIGDRAV